MTLRSVSPADPRDEIGVFEVADGGAVNRAEGHGHRLETAIGGGLSRPMRRRLERDDLPRRRRPGGAAQKHAVAHARHTSEPANAEAAIIHGADPPENALGVELAESDAELPPSDADVWALLEPNFEYYGKLELT